MWPFRAKPADPTLAARLSALTERVEELERNQKDLALEWEETYGKVRRVLARINRANAKMEAEGSDDPGTGASGTGPALRRPSNGGITVLDAKARLGLG